MRLPKILLFSKYANLFIHKGYWGYVELNQRCGGSFLSRHRTST